MGLGSEGQPRRHLSSSGSNTGDPWIQTPRERGSAKTMGHVRISRAVRARIGFWLSLLLIVAGVYYVWGAGPAMIVGGALRALSFLLLAETGERGGRRVR